QVGVVHTKIRWRNTFGRPKARKGHGIFRFPVSTLQIVNVQSIEKAVHPPVFEAKKYAQAYFVYTCAANPVRRIQPVVKVRLLAFWVVVFVNLPVVGFLIYKDGIYLGFVQGLIIVGFQWLYLNRQLWENRGNQL